MSESLSSQHLDVLRLVRNDVATASDISDSLDLPRTTVRRRLDDLLEHNLVSKRVAGNARFYELTDDGCALLDSGVGVKPEPRSLRVHKVQWSADLVRAPWDLHDKLLEHSFTVSEHNNWKKYSHTQFLAGLTIAFHPEKVHFWLDEFWLDTPMEYYPVAQKKLLKACESLQERFPGLKLGSPNRLFTIHSNHVARPSGPLARYFERKALETGVAKVYHGKNLNIDHSDGVWEEETVDPRLAPAHMEDLAEFFDSWVENPFFAGEIADLNAQSSASASALDEVRGRQDRVEERQEEFSRSLAVLFERHEEFSRSLSVLSERQAADTQKILGSVDELDRRRESDHKQYLKSLDGFYGDFTRALEFQRSQVENTNRVLERIVGSMGRQQVDSASQREMLLVLSRLSLQQSELLRVALERSRPWYVKAWESIRGLWPSKRKNI